MLFFLLLPLAALAYTAWHIWLILPLGMTWRVVAVGLWVAAFCSAFLNFSRTIDRFPLWLGTTIYEIGNSAIFILLYLTMIFIVIDVLRLLNIVPHDIATDNAWMAIAITVVLTAVFVYGNIHYYNKGREQLTITTSKPIQSDTLTIVMASDLHIGYHNRRSELARWIDMINREKPDLVLFCGDIIDISTRPLLEEGMAKEFLRLKAPAYACFGNHEYYAGIDKSRQFYAAAGIHLLCDSVTTSQGITIIGRDDRTNNKRKPLSSLVNQADKNSFLLLLDHQPMHLEQAEQTGIDFQFSGHTHYGQLWPVSWITRLLYEDAYGEHQCGSTRYYVSSGLGIWGGKFRIGTRSEYVVCKIVSTAK